MFCTDIGSHIEISTDAQSSGSLTQVKNVLQSPMQQIIFFKLHQNFEGINPY